MGKVRGKSLFVLLAFVVSATTSYGSAYVEFPGMKPGKATAKVASGAASLSNNVISMTWKFSGNGVEISSITNKLAKKTIKQSSPAFKIWVEGNAEITDWKTVKPPVVVKLKTNPSDSSMGRRIPGKGIRVELQSQKTGIAISWTAECRDGAGYVRSIIVLKALPGASAKKITRIDFFNGLSLTSPEQKGNVNGSIVVADGMFFGVEAPFAKNSIKNGVLSAGFKCKFGLKKGMSYPFASVVGVYFEGQLRRSFLHYMERARSRSYRQFLQYNCWFDLCRNLNEEKMLDRINMINAELAVKRHVPVLSYVVDDGYDDSTLGFWAFNKTKFPNGFTPLAKKLAEIRSHLGVWLSPSGGYGKDRKIRRNQAAKLGFPNLDLSNDKYYEWFLKRHTAFIKDEQVNYFKWDNLGGGVSGHFMGLMDIARKLRKMNPQLFLNATVGTWQSPFWLNYVDCTWRGGGDMGFTGKGCEREKWITYRDAFSYKALAKSAFVYPLNALMNHGLIYSDGHSFPKRVMKGDSLQNFTNEARSYFGGGYALQELYINPHLLKKEHWDIIAESARWAKANERILVDTHFVGGNPNDLEIYGFASWNGGKGTLTLRNPDDKPATIQLDIRKTFELPKGAPMKYSLVSPYANQRLKRLAVVAGKPIAIEIKPFEVLVFDAIPAK